MKSNLKEIIKEFIAIPTIANNKLANDEAILLLRALLESLGFVVTIEGNSKHCQPVIMARREVVGASNGLVLYNHYDVEKINAHEGWHSDPFELTELNGRYFGRGIADNKAVLLARIFALRELIESGHKLPNILWAIQGEEEIEGRTPFEVFPEHFKTFSSLFYIEETGMYRENLPVILYQSENINTLQLIDKLNNLLYQGTAILERRKLNKFNECAFFNSIPAQGIYIAFGPNDERCNIHAENENLDIHHLEQHIGLFQKFVLWVSSEQLRVELIPQIIS